MDVTGMDPEGIAAYERLVADVPREGEVMRHSSDTSHEAASNMDLMLRGWSPSYGSADADIIPEKMELDARGRDVRRNDGYVQSAENQHKDSIVGARFLLNSKPETTVLLGAKGDDKWELDFQEEVETKFMLAADSPGNWLDASGTLDFTGLVRLAMGVGLASGEVLATGEWDRDSDRPFKTCVQLIEGDRLRTPFEFATDPDVRGGVRVNRLGRALGCYIQQKHPGDRWTGYMNADWRYVQMAKPWGRRQAVLLRDPKRPGQTRCISDIVAGMKEVRTTHRFRDIMVQNAITNGIFAASIESEVHPDIIAAQLNGGATENGGLMAAEYAAGYMTGIQEYSKNAKGIKLDGVRIPHLFPGTKLNLRPAGTPGGVGSEFEVSLLRYVAASLGLSYEEFSRDYSRTNYSSIKAAINTTYRYQQTRKKLFADVFATIIFALWFEEQMNAGNIEAMKYSKLPNYYDGLMKEAYTKCDWIGASFGQIDELKETQAAALRLKNNLSTHEQEFGRQGKDWRKQFKQKAREKALMTELDILPVDEDPNMMNAASGTPREPDKTDDTGQSSGDKRDDN